MTGVVGLSDVGHFLECLIALGRRSSFGPSGETRFYRFPAYGAWVLAVLTVLTRVLAAESRFAELRGIGRPDD